MKLQLNDVLSKLGSYKKDTNGWIATCPAHKDDKPSLSIKEDNGKAILHCFAGCEYVQVVQALGLNERERNEQKKEVAVYDYEDENGKLLYQSVRYQPKEFRVRRPDGKDGWDWKLGDTRRVIYRLSLIHISEPTRPY